MSSRSRGLARSARIRLSATLTVSVGSVSLLLAGVPAASATTTYSATGAPSVDKISGAPWTTSQGEQTEGGRFPESDLFPTYTPPTAGLTGAFTLLGGITEPNLAVFPATAATEKPYPSGVAGTPGPLDGYCSSLGANPETGSPVSEPAGARDPFAPYYFPDVMREGTELLGFFDYRPKDAEEAITAARSTDNGVTWTTDGKALGQNGGYCPTADTNDDGQGHPYMMTVGESTELYTLQRSAGDSTGIGLLVHPVKPEAANPLAELPAQQATGVDANTFVEATETVPTSGGVAIKVSTLGEAGSLEHIVAGRYEDHEASSPSTQTITCTGTATSPATELTGCTVAGGSALIVRAKDDLLQVIATVGSATHPAPFTVPAGPNNTKGEGGTEHVYFTNANTEVSPLTTYTMNVNAPNRVYIGSHTVYCAQANANPTTQVEDCTAPAGSFTATTELPITADPIIPPETRMTTGLLAPDGIIGTLKSYEGAGRETEKAPAGATVVLYTQKILNYFVVGIENGSVSGSTYTSGKFTFPKSIINYTPSATGSEEPLPSTGSFHIYVGTKLNGMQELTCSGREVATQTGVPAGSYDLTGCSGGTGEVVKEAWLGGPGAATVSGTELEKVGEGKNGATSGPEKLYGNNEDYEVVRAAYTYNGIEFHDLGLLSGHDNGAGATSGTYNDLSDPFQQVSPSTEKPTNMAVGESDTTELRWPGSRGTIVTNPDGSYGMFMSGAWASDGDSDAFNQIFYSSSTNGYEWTVPKVVLSTDYTFGASIEQSEELQAGFRDPLGVSAYYSGRAYGPTVVQNPNGSLTMVFAGYHIPKTISAAGTTLGTGTKKYVIKSTEPALYRNILTMGLSSSSSPLVATTTAVSASDSGSGVVGAPVTYTATVAPVSPGTGTPTGTVSFSTKAGTISGCTVRPLNEGSPDTATCTTTHGSSATSDEEVTATYSHDSNYAVSTSSKLAETTTKAATSTSVASSDSGTGVVGAAVTYTATVSVTSPGAGSPTGTVSFAVGGHAIGTCGSQTLSGTTATCSTAHGASVSANEEVTATYSGDSNFTGSESSALTEATTQAATATTVSASDEGSGVVGAAVTYTATVSVNSPGSGDPTGTVSFSTKSGTISSCTAKTLSGTTATCTTTHGSSVSANEEVTATYSGDSNFTGSTSSTLAEATTQAATGTSVASSDSGTGVVGAAVTYTATVTVSSPGSGTPTGTVNFSGSTGGTPGILCTNENLTTVVSGGQTHYTATCTTTHAASVGTEEITATYSGDSNFTGSESSALTETTGKAVTATTIASSDSGSGVVGAAVTYTATMSVNSPGSGAPTGTVSFAVGGHAIGTCESQTLSGATATCTTAHGASVSANEEVTATYSGDSNFTGSTSSALSEATTQAATGTSVASSDSGTGVVGAAVTYTATVTVSSPGSGTPTGTVNFSGSTGGTPGILCTNENLTTVVSGGQTHYTATCTTTHAASVGTEEITATYSGDSNFTGSESSALTETTGKAVTATTIASSDSGSGVVGAAVTYTASVAAVSPATGTPSGTVSFSDEAGPISGCTGIALSGGSASCETTHAASVGSDEVAVAYSGDSNYGESASMPLLETTGKDSTSISVSSGNSGSGVVGAPLAYTATVAVASPGSGTPAGTVSFSDKAGPIAGCTSIALSAATPDTAACPSRHALAVGTDEITATYHGDSNDEGSVSTPFTETTAKAATTTTVHSSDSGSGPVGSTVTYTATIAVHYPGTGTPTGTVSFSAGGATIPGCGNRPLDEGASDDATCTTTHASTPGSASITVTYGGDANYTGSGSPSLTEATTQAATVTSLRSSDEGSGVKNTAVTYTATVTVHSPGAGTPTGTVSFASNGTPITACAAKALTGTATDTATCVTVHPSATGGESITATYAESASFTGSSASLTERTTAAASANVLWASPATTVVGHGTSCTHPGYNTIQAAIAAAKLSAKIMVCAGTYTEQLQITQAVTLTAESGATLQLPASPQNSTTACDPSTGTHDQELVVLCGPGHVTITGLTLKAEWPTGTCATNRYGILVGDEADLILTRDAIAGAGVSPLSGCDSGVAIQVGRSLAAASQIGTAKLTEDTVSGYQQAGVVIDGPGSTATATAVTVNGAGATTELAQTGIEVSNGAKATITRSSVSGNECNSSACGSDALTEQQGVGVRFYGAAYGSKVTASTISSNDVGVAYQDTEVTAPPASQVTIGTDTLASNRYEAVLLDQGWASVNSDTIETGDVAIEVLQRNGQSYGEHGAGSKDTISRMSQWAVEGLSDQHSGNPAGLFTISASHISGNPTNTVAGSVHSDSSNLVITTTRSDS